MSSLWWTDPAALATALGRLGVAAKVLETPSRLALPVLGPSPTGRVAAGMPTVPPLPAPLPQSFVPPEGELGERLDAYLAWLGAAVGGRRAFVADRDGLPLAGEASEHDLMAIGSAMTRLLERINDRARHRLATRVLLEVAGERLQLVMVQSEIGVATVGALFAEPPPPPLLRRLEEGLRAALAGAS